MPNSEIDPLNRAGVTMYIFRGEPTGERNTVECKTLDTNLLLLYIYYKTMFAEYVPKITLYVRKQERIQTLVILILTAFPVRCCVPSGS